MMTIGNYIKKESRRNSNDERRSLFDRSFSHYDTAIDFLIKPPSRSFSIDVGSMQSSFFDNTATTSLFQQNSSRYLFNNNSNYGLFATSDLEIEASKLYWQLYPESVGNAFYAQPTRRFSHSWLTSTNQEARKENLEINKFSGLQLQDFYGKLYELCKDQHGCRFLQLKLDESKLNVNIIYQEILNNFVELMTDPFGNYLCQKLLEKCDDHQRSSIVQVISSQFLKICLSMHGTRAVQKLIEFLSTKRQIQAVIAALEPNVVALIKDLNGNHVIQKCLYKLSAENNQFIYDIVSKNCIEVASHKHGCCVYQRCIDRATPSQKTQLVHVITQNALPLVQDPFGNYVVQYVLELGDAKYTDNLIRRFIDPIRELSVQKFSSNVIEKCIRVAEKDTKRLLIAGITKHPQMESFLRDSYANYVIQTCLDFAEQDQRNQFIDRIRPLLPSIRNTPYGKRIYSKIHQSPVRTR